MGWEEVTVIGLFWHLIWTVLIPAILYIVSLGLSLKYGYEPFKALVRRPKYLVKSLIASEIIFGIGFGLFHWLMLPAALVFVPMVLNGNEAAKSLPGGKRLKVLGDK